MPFGCASHRHYLSREKPFPTAFANSNKKSGCFVGKSNRMRVQNLLLQKGLLNSFLDSETPLQLRQRIVDITLHNTAAGKGNTGFQHRAQVRKVEKVAQGFLTTDVAFVTEFHGVVI